MLPVFSDILDASRNVNINNLRLISLTFFIVSLTPIGSIYVLFFSTWGVTSTVDPNTAACTGQVMNGENAVWSSSSSQCSQTLDTAASSTATADSLYYWIGPPDVPWDIASTTPNSIYMHRHWTAVIAWLIALVFGIVIPMILYVFSCIRSHRLRREREEYHSAHRTRRRRGEIAKCLSNHTKTLKDNDRDTTNEAPNMDITDPCRNTCCSWRLPLAGCTNDIKNNNNARSVSGLCAICLHNYEPGQRVVWSSNQKCCHSFHLDCLLDWFASRRRKSYSCPCCRQWFFSKQEEAKQKIP